MIQLAYCIEFYKYMLHKIAVIEKQLCYRRDYEAVTNASFN